MWGVVVHHAPFIVPSVLIRPFLRVVCASTTLWYRETTPIWQCGCSSELDVCHVQRVSLVIPTILVTRQRGVRLIPLVTRSNKHGVGHILQRLAGCNLRRGEAGVAGVSHTFMHLTVPVQVRGCDYSPSLSPLHHPSGTYQPTPFHFSLLQIPVNVEEVT